jgi:cholesterol oxidase
MAPIPLTVDEFMEGYIGFGAADYNAGFIQGIDGAEGGTTFSHAITIKMADIDGFVSEASHEATVEGHIVCPPLGDKRPILRGTFNMLVEEPNANLRVMLYRMVFADAGGELWTMLGHKTIHNDHSLSLWPDITTLYIRLLKGDVPGPDIASISLPGQVPPPGPNAAMGTIHISTLDAFRSARSFHSPGSNPFRAAEAVAKFVEFYFHGVWDVFGKSHKVTT